MSVSSQSLRAVILKVGSPGGPRLSGPFEVLYLPTQYLCEARLFSHTLIETTKLNAEADSRVQLSPIKNDSEEVTEMQTPCSVFQCCFGKPFFSIKAAM